MDARYRNRDNGYVHTQSERSAFLELACDGLWELLDDGVHGPAPWGRPDEPPADDDKPPAGGVADVDEPLPAGAPAAPMSAVAPNQGDPHDDAVVHAIVEPAQAGDHDGAAAAREAHLDAVPGAETGHGVALHDDMRRPAKSATRAEWAAYVLHLGGDVDNERDTKGDLVARADAILADRA